MNTLVSIAIATYNGEKYLREQLDSIYSQTYKNIEVIASDDASTDGTVAILKEYKKKYRLNYSVNEKNVGLLKNFENALLKCRGEYIALCDQDDIWLPEKIETLVREIGHYSMICSDALIIDARGNLVAESMFTHTKRRFFHQNQFQHLLYTNFITGCTLLIKRDILQKSLPFPGFISYHDRWLAIMASLNEGITLFHRPLIRYRVHGANQTDTGFKYTYKSLLDKIAEFRTKNRNDFFCHEILWMTELLKMDAIDDDKKIFIKERIAFYRNLSDSWIHYRSAYIAVKHGKYMLSKRNPLDKVMFVVMTLFAR